MENSTCFKCALFFADLETLVDGKVVALYELHQLRPELFFAEKFNKIEKNRNETVVRLVVDGYNAVVVLCDDLRFVKTDHRVQETKREVLLVRKSTYNFLEI